MERVVSEPEPGTVPQLINVSGSWRFQRASIFVARGTMAMLAFLVGCRVPPGELIALRMRSVQRREGHWVVADLLVSPAI